MPIELDTECLLLLGLLLCKDRNGYKAKVFYSLLRSACQPKKTKKSELSFMAKDFDELNCMDEAVESAIFKLCILSTMFIEYHALPVRPGKTEFKMLQTAFAMRTSVYFEVFQTFVQHVWVIPEKFYVTSPEFAQRMSQYPLNHFLQTGTFRRMISLQMPDKAIGIQKARQRASKGLND